MEKWTESVYSDGSQIFVSNPLPSRGDGINIYLRAYEDSPIEGVFLRTKINGMENIIEMKKDYVEDGLAYYKSDNVNVYEDVFHYHFYLLSQGRIYYYNQRGVTDCIPDETYDFKVLVDYTQPKWVKEAVFYQIFPERFCNGNKDNDVKTNEYYFDGYPAVKISNWNEEPKGYNEAHCLDFYGGDLEGIKSKIPYLKELGINAIYLNPIFYAATVHKYDCLDYFHVDPHFGGDKAFEELMNALHENDMRLVLDTSVNHTGIANKWFNRDGTFFDKSIGAYNNKDSKERNYYFFNEDNSYKAWYNVDTLPTLNYTSKELRNIIYEGEDSLVKKWLKPPYSIDGWRFDVADTMARNDEIQLHHEVWPGIRKSVKEENKEAYILAEDWADHAEFMKGNEWDSAMNYFGFGMLARAFAGKDDLTFRLNKKLKNVQSRITAKALANRLRDHLGKLPFVMWQNQFNLFDSHDTPRLHNYKDLSFEDYRSAVIMMFTMIGAPSMYYGDEAGIDGRIGDMEGCRYPMPWDKDIKSTKYYKLYSKLAHLKTSEVALQDGGFKILSEEGYVISFARFTKKELIIVVCSTDDKDRAVRINLKSFGKFDMKFAKEIFDTEINYYDDGEDIVFCAKAHTSYVIKL